MTNKTKGKKEDRKKAKMVVDPNVSLQRVQKKAKMVVDPNVSLQRVQLNYIRILAVFFIERDR